MSTIAPGSSPWNSNRMNISQMHFIWEIFLKRSIAEAYNREILKLNKIFRHFHNSELNRNKFRDQPLEFNSFKRKEKCLETMKGEGGGDSESSERNCKCNNISIWQIPSMQLTKQSKRNISIVRKRYLRFEFIINISNIVYSKMHLHIHHQLFKFHYNSSSKI